MFRWFEAEGVRFVSQPDGCVFPESQDAMQIVRTLERLMRQLGIRVVCGRRVVRLHCAVAGSPADGGAGAFVLEFSDGSRESADRVLLASGGSNAAFLRNMLPESVEIVPTVPSLFTFRVADEKLHALMGTVVENAVAGIAGTSFRSEGTLLITDWGFSGPAALKLSSYAARYLAEHGYEAPLLVNWCGCPEGVVRAWLADAAESSPRRQLGGIRPAGITARLWEFLLVRAGIRAEMRWVWEFLLARAGIRAEMRWAELGAKVTNRLVSVLTADSYGICGRAAFKEEFVTCGGVALSSVDPGTLECRSVPGLYFAGEVLDIDAVTGGFNLQSAWSCAHVAAGALK